VPFRMRDTSDNLWPKNGASASATLTWELIFRSKSCLSQCSTSIKNAPRDPMIVVVDTDGWLVGKFLDTVSPMRPAIKPTTPTAIKASTTCEIIVPARDGVSSWRLPCSFRLFSRPRYLWQLPLDSCLSPAFLVESHLSVLQSPAPQHRGRFRRNLVSCRFVTWCHFKLSLRGQMFFHKIKLTHYQQLSQLRDTATMMYLEVVQKL